MIQHSPHSKFLQFELGLDALGNSPLDLDDRHICQIPLGSAILLGSGAAVQGAGAAAGGKKGASAATNAAQLQYQAAQQEIALQNQTRTQNLGILDPFVQMGTNAIQPFMNYLQGAFSQPIDTTLPSFSYPQFAGQPPAPFTFDPSNISNTAGYQYQLKQVADMGMGAAALTGGKVGSTSINNIMDLANSLAGTNWMNNYNAQLGQYQAGLQGYNAQLAGYQTNFNSASSQYTSNTNALLASRNQALGQKAQTLAGYLDPVNIGLGAGGALANSNINLTGQQVASIGQGGAALSSGQIGAAQAGIGAISGITGATNQLTSGILNQQNFAQLLGMGAGGNSNYWGGGGDSQGGVSGSGAGGDSGGGTQIG